MCDNCGSTSGELMEFDIAIPDIVPIKLLGGGPDRLRLNHDYDSQIDWGYIVLMILFFPFSLLIPIIKYFRRRKNEKISRTLHQEGC